MTRQQRDRALTDQELDRALAQALDVKPRPDFLAHVRSRIAKEPAPSIWLDWWRAVAVSAAMAVVAVAAYWPAEETRTLPRAVTRVAPAASAAAPAIAVAAVPVAARRPTIVRSAPAPRALPAVQISSDDAQIVRLAVDGARDGLFASTAEPDDTAPLPVSSIVLPPLEVMPLAQMAQVDSGERQ